MKDNPKNPDDRLDSLFAEARAGETREEHPREFGFEDRLMRRLAENRVADATAPSLFWQRLAPVSPIVTGLLTLGVITWSAAQVQEVHDMLILTQDALSLSGLFLGV